MTVEVKEKFTVTSKRTDHPNAKKYPGRPSMEFGTALRKFLGDLTPEERELFRTGELVFEEEYSAEFFDSILPGDVVGLGVLKGLNNEPCAYKFKIITINKDADTMMARNCTWEDEKRNPGYVGEVCQLTFEEFSCGLGMGFGEILERDGKPYGVSEEIEQTVVIYGESAEVEDPSTGKTGKIEAK